MDAKGRINTELANFGLALYSKFTDRLTELYLQVMFHPPIFEKLCQAMGYQFNIVPFNLLNPPSQTTNHLITTTDVSNQAADMLCPYRVGIFFSLEQGEIAVLFPIADSQPRSVALFVKGKIAVEDAERFVEKMDDWFVENMAMVKKYLTNIRV